jgi:hypothetical protein
MGARNPERYVPRLGDGEELAAWVQNYAGWHILFVCSNCPHVSLQSPRRLLMTRTPPRTIGELRRRAVCEKCGGRRFRLEAKYSGSGNRR